VVGYFVPIAHEQDGSTIEAAVERLRSEAKQDDALAGLRNRREEILKLCAMHGASNVRVFGSVVRGDATSKSDIDILVDFEKGRSLFDLGGLAADLESLLGRSADVVTERSLKPSARDSVLAEAEPL